MPAEDPEHGGKSGPKAASKEREKRLAEALRANLRRRKQQGRARREEAKPDADNGEPR
jgi:hypothetical protein